MVRPNRAGFTLTELMVVVVIVGILASIAIPRYRDLATRAKEAEVEPLLRQVLTLQERHRAREGSYTLDLALLEGGGSLPESGDYYAFSILAHATGFCIAATPNAAGIAAGVRARSLDAARRFHASGDCS